jgi:hypothetical protein
VLSISDGDSEGSSEGSQLGTIDGIEEFVIKGILDVGEQLGEGEIFVDGFKEAVSVGATVGSTSLILFALSIFLSFSLLSTLSVKTSKNSVWATPRSGASTSQKH